VTPFVPSHAPSRTPSLIDFNAAWEREKLRDEEPAWMAYAPLDETPGTTKAAHLAPPADSNGLPPVLSPVSDLVKKGRTMPDASQSKSAIPARRPRPRAPHGEFCQCPACVDPRVSWEQPQESKQAGGSRYEPPTPPSDEPEGGHDMNPQAAPRPVPRPKPPAKATLPQQRSGERYAVVFDGWIGKLGNPDNTAVFVALCLYANSTTGQAWPPLATLCDRCYGVSITTLKRRLRALRTLGAITLIEQGKGRTPSRYQINQSPPLHKDAPIRGGQPTELGVHQHDPPSKQAGRSPRVTPQGGHPG
jgi:hypothetical protein